MNWINYVDHAGQVVLGSFGLVSFGLVVPSWFGWVLGGWVVLAVLGRFWPGRVGDRAGFLAWTKGYPHLSPARAGAWRYPQLSKSEGNPSTSKIFKVGKGVTLNSPKVRVTPRRGKVRVTPPPKSFKVD